MNKQPEGVGIFDRAGARHRLTQSMYLIAERGLENAEEIRELATKAYIEMAQIKAVLRAIRLLVKI